MLELDNVHSALRRHLCGAGRFSESRAWDCRCLAGKEWNGQDDPGPHHHGPRPARAGKISYDETGHHQSAPYKISPLGLSLVPQGRRIFPSLSVRENLLLGMRGKGWTPERIYSLFPVLEKRAGNKGNQLSGGEQQMLAIARAMLANPDIILMDEPSEGLAPIVIESIGDVIVD